MSNSPFQQPRGWRWQANGAQNLRNSNLPTCSSSATWRPMPVPAPVGWRWWLTATNFINNTAGADGGAPTTRPLEIATQISSTNQATGSQGAGRRGLCQAATAVTVTASTFLTNTATRSGGAADTANNGSIWRIETAASGQSRRLCWRGAIGTKRQQRCHRQQRLCRQPDDPTSTTTRGCGLTSRGRSCQRQPDFDHNVAVGSAGALHAAATQITNTTFSLNRSLAVVRRSASKRLQQCRHCKQLLPDQHLRQQRRRGLSGGDRATSPPRTSSAIRQTAMAARSIQMQPRPDPRPASSNPTMRRKATAAAP